MRPEILDGPDTRVQFGVQRLELVLDLGPGLTADLLADPLPVRGKAERDHAAPAAGTGLVVGAGPAVAPVVEVDAVFAVAPAFGEVFTFRPDLGRRGLCGGLATG